MHCHFPDVKVEDSGDFVAWSRTFLSEVDASLRQKAAAAEVAAAAELKATSNVAIETLEKQAHNYKSILAEKVSTFFTALSFQVAMK